jgi:hypothetical protein
MASYAREENELFAAAISRAGRDAEGEDTFLSRLALQITRKGQPIPAVTVAFKDLKVDVKAFDSAGALPSLPNVLRRGVQVRSTLVHDQLMSV